MYWCMDKCLMTDLPNKKALICNGRQSLWRKQSYQMQLGRDMQHHTIVSTLQVQ